MNVVFGDDTYSSYKFICSVVSGKSFIVTSSVNEALDVVNNPFVNYDVVVCRVGEGENIGSVIKTRNVYLHIDGPVTHKIDVKNTEFAVPKKGRDEYLVSICEKYLSSAGMACNKKLLRVFVKSVGVDVWFLINELHKATLLASCDGRSEITFDDFKLSSGNHKGHNYSNIFLSIMDRNKNALMNEILLVGADGAHELIKYLNVGVSKMYMFGLIMDRVKNFEKAVEESGLNRWYVTNFVYGRKWEVGGLKTLMSIMSEAEAVNYSYPISTIRFLVSKLLETI